MAVSHPLSPARRGWRPLLLGPGGDVELVDLAEVAPGEVDRRVGELVATGATVAVTATDPTALCVAAQAGALVVLAAEGTCPALERAADLVQGGVPAAQVVVEVPFGPGPAPGAELRAVGIAGFAAGIVVAPLDPSEGADAEAGWQIGALTATLALGVRTVRGVSAERFRRVLAVVEAIDDARDDLDRRPPGTGTA